MDVLKNALFRRYIYESIPWLVANNRKPEAERILRYAAKVNGTELPDTIFDETQEMVEPLVITATNQMTKRSLTANSEESTGE